MFMRRLTLVLILAALTSCSPTPQPATLADNGPVQWDSITGPTSLSRVYQSNLVQQR